MTELYGIDISTAQGEINWDALAQNKDLSFVIIRASQGLAQDSRFARNIEECQRVGLPFGLYFAASASTETGVAAEADFASNYCKKYKPQYGAWYDMELKHQRELGKDMITKLLKRWLDTVKETGVRCGIYTNKDWLDNRIDISKLDGYDLWYAAYPSITAKKITDGRKDNRSKLSYPQSVIWQWSSKGSVEGISGNVDLNICYEKFQKEQKPISLGYIALEEVKKLVKEMGYEGIVL